MLKTLLRLMFYKFRILTELRQLLEEIRELTLYDQTVALQSNHTNPLNRVGAKCFSQSEEDGITIEILRRMDCISAGTFLEFGVGNGSENNTLLLRSLGWRGVWFGGEDLIASLPTRTDNFLFKKTWITKENVVSLAREGLTHLNVMLPDLVSLDLDGNDYYLTEQLLQTELKPKLFIVEYNAKFQPPIKWKIDYDPNHRWLGDDYFGASLCSFIELFTEHGYTLVCCNSHTGANAFFVKNMYIDYFSDVPKDPRQLHVSPRYFLRRRYGYNTSELTLRSILRT